MPCAAPTCGKRRSKKGGCALASRERSASSATISSGLPITALVTATRCCRPMLRAQAAGWETSVPGGPDAVVNASAVLVHTTCRVSSDRTRQVKDGRVAHNFKPFASLIGNELDFQLFGIREDREISELDPVDRAGLSAGQPVLGPEFGV